MKNNTAIENIKLAYDENSKWLKFAHMLINGESNDIIQDPVPFTQCPFGLWMYSEGHCFTRFSWFKDVQEQHQKTHDTYSKLYNETLRVYKPKTYDELLECLAKLEKQTAVFHKVLEVAEKNISLMSDEEYERLVSSSTQNKDSDKTETQHTQRVSDMKPVPVKTRMTAQQVELRLKLKQQDLKQLDLEKKLTKQELDQLIERHKLTQQSVEQLKQYQELKEQESEFLHDDHGEQEIENKKAQNEKIQELKRLDEEKVKKQVELEQMELLSLKLEQKKNEGHRQEEENLRLLEQNRQLIKDEILKLDLLQEQRRDDLVKFKEQVALTEQELADLEGKKLEKLQEVKLLKEKQANSQTELEQEGVRQQQLNEHKLQVEELKHQDLQKLKEQYQYMQQELLLLEQGLQELNKNKKQSEKQKEVELEQLLEQQRLKQEILNDLESNQTVKKQDLEKLEGRYASLSLEVMDLEEKLVSPKSEESTSDKHTEKS